MWEIIVKSMKLWLLVNILTLQAYSKAAVFAASSWFTCYFWLQCIHTLQCCGFKSTSLSLHGWNLNLIESKHSVLPFNSLITCQELLNAEAILCMQRHCWAEIMNVVSWSDHPHSWATVAWPALFLFLCVMNLTTDCRYSAGKITEFEPLGNGGQRFVLTFSWYHPDFFLMLALSLKREFVRD